MLNKLTLTNFGCHERLTIEFGPGLNAVKAAVEKGKSTVFKGIAYALFGAKALPDSLEDTVTWGQPVATLKSELIFTVNGTIYTMTRGKSGAELVYDGGTVTGQTETAKFVADLLGVDAGLAANLLIANQQDIRGALTGGAKGATALIEKLADFEKLENLIELLTGALPTGSTVAVKAALEEAQRVLEETAEPAPLDTAAMASRLQTLKSALDTRTAVVNSLSNDLKRARAARDAVLEKYQRRRELEQKVDERKASVKQLEAASPTVLEAVDEAALQRAQAEVERVKAQISLAKQYTKFSEINSENVLKWGVPSDPDNSRYEDTPEKAKDKHDFEKLMSQAIERQASDADKEAVKARALIIRDSCTLCGKDVSEIPEVASRNAELLETAEKQEAHAAHLRAQAQDCRDTAAALHEVMQAHKDLVAAAQGLPVEVETTTTPGWLVWKGGEPDLGAEENLAAALAAHDDLRAQKIRYAESVRAAKQHAEQVEKAKTGLVDLIVELADLQAEELDVEGAKAKAHEVEVALEGAREEFQQAQSALQAEEAEQRIAKSEYESATRARQSAQKTVDTRVDELKEMEFNNALMKAIREARPVVANKLWALVLGAVSQYFSEMRGQPCTVSRGPDGFTVDDHPVSTLSGSTKDILGLAIRVALTRTFLPNIGMMLLDEPNAAMDDDRTSNVLGFISGVGFDQTIVVSHDEMTVDVADHVVTLE